MATRALPVDERRTEGHCWATVLHRAQDGSEYAHRVPLRWVRSEWALSTLPTPSGWPWEPSAATQDDYRNGVFVPWFIFHSAGHVAPLVLDTDTAYLLSRGARALLRVPQAELDGLPWFVARITTDPGSLRHVGDRNAQLAAAHWVFHRFEIFRSTRLLVGRWLERRDRRRRMADHLRVAIQGARGLSGMDGIGTAIGTYIAGPPVLPPYAPRLRHPQGDVGGAGADTPPSPIPDLV